MTSWLIDIPLFKVIASAKPMSVRNWLESNDASVFLAAASLVEIAAAIAKGPVAQTQRREAMGAWLEGLASQYADRIYPVDLQIAMRAGEIMPHLQIGHMRYRFHDALLLATAQLHGHGLLTRRDSIFGPWTNVPIATP
jgi:predicted nucleic acid-binding protein